MRLVIHPGHAKCGSTSIQEFLYLNREVLLEKGFLVPDNEFRLPGDPDFNKKAKTPRNFFRKLFVNGGVRFLDARIKKIESSYPDGTLIVTAENLTNFLGGDIGTKIHELLNKRFNDIQVIYYIKRQDSFLLSAWQQWGYKQGVGLSQYISRAVSLNAPDYLGVVNELESVYSRDAIEVRPIGKKTLFREDLIEDFCFRAKLPNENYVPLGKSANKSLSPILCSLLSSMPDMFDDPHDEKIKQLLERLCRKNDVLYERFDSIIDMEDRRKIFEKFDPQNRQLHERYFPDIDYCDFFSIEVSSKKQIDEADKVDYINSYYERLIEQMIRSCRDSSSLFN